jgi:hypothetical protein
MLDRKMKVSYQKWNGEFTWVLFGYDQYEKYRTTRVSIAEMNRIFVIIDRMPMRKNEIKRN